MRDNKQTKPLQHRLKYTLKDAFRLRARGASGEKKKKEKKKKEKRAGSIDLGSGSEAFSDTVFL